MKMSEHFTKRRIGHDEALEAAQRLVNSHFHNPDHARVSIPARPDYDDDLVLKAYVYQQREKETPSKWEMSMETELCRALESVASDGWSGDAMAVGIEEAVAVILPLLQPPGQPDYKEAEHALSEAYLRLGHLIPGALDTPHAPSREEVWRTTEEALMKLLKAPYPVVVAAEQARITLQSIVDLHGPDPAGLCLSTLNALDKALSEKEKSPGQPVSGVR